MKIYANVIRNKYQKKAFPIKIDTNLFLDFLNVFILLRLYFT